MVLPLAGGRVGRCQFAPPDYFGSREAFLLAVFKGFVGAKLASPLHFYHILQIDYKQLSNKQYSFI